MGPKRSSTEGAGSSSSSLLHKVARTLGRKGVRRLVHAFYIRRKYPTITAVLEKAREECGFPGGRFCFWRVLKGMGFTYIQETRQQKIHVRTHKHTGTKTHILVHYTQTETRTYKPCIHRRDMGEPTSQQRIHMG